MDSKPKVLQKLAINQPNRNQQQNRGACQTGHKAPPPPALNLGTLPRSAPIINPISNWETKLVVNLSPAHIDPLAFNFLKRGLNFALTPRSIPHIDFLIEIENVVRTLPLDVAEEVRQDCAVALRYAKPPKFNIPKAELLAFNNLMHNNDLIISRADKGNATVIMSKPDYLAKMEILLSDSSSFKILSRNPCPKILKAVRSAISNSSLDDSTKLRLLPSKEVTPRIYGVPKIHKANIPLRPIVDTIGSPTYKLAAFLAKLISPLVGNSNSFIKDSNQFVQFIKDTKLDPQDTLVSFDVVSLFTKVPILDAIEIVKLKVNEEIASLVELCLRSTFFAFQGVIYEQVDGVAMGSPLSPVIANIFMEHFEEVALHSFPLKPKWWKRYMDDTNVCWPHGLDMLEEFHTHLNNISPSITFTKELESNNLLSFLDVLICKKPDGSLGRQVFRKTTHTDLYLHSSSHHHHSQKVGILKTLALRAHRICDKDNLDQELSHLRQVFLWNGYSNKKITRAFLQAKSHFLSISNPVPSPSQAPENNFFKRKVKEAIAIIQHPSNLNRDDGLNLSISWHPLLLALQRHPRPPP
ncbi:uncharacterized protein LOC131044502 [Cryptomeria japonica]|uniref:uncharacterized protein LOC131044502 n=1 Tax=Cryptomeria japonica TaxID=3369 RepID=UPI0027DA0989|nr:uncharacterized protein LOC131044502 [Cryptomeria japonica]